MESVHEGTDGEERSKAKTAVTVSIHNQGTSTLSLLYFWPFYRDSGRTERPDFTLASPHPVSLPFSSSSPWGPKPQVFLDVYRGYFVLVHIFFFS